MNTVLRYALSLVIWSIWCLIAIICISVALLLSTFVPDGFLNTIVRTGCQILTYSALLFPRLKCTFKGDLSFPVLYAANHVSFFDLFICGSVLPDNPRGIQLAEHFKKPFYGWGITRFGEIPIDVTSRTSIVKSFKMVTKILENKARSILIMPEGRRTLTGKLGAFGSGVFYLSRKSRVPIVPVVINGLFRLNNRTSIMIRPGCFDVTLLDPVSPELFNSDEEMANHVKELMERELCR